MTDVWHSDDLAVPGTYCLILKLEEATRIRIGGMGRIAFPRGWYAYVGSAFGPGGLKARLGQHSRPASRLHWHIDYFRYLAELEGAFFTLSQTPCEHLWATSAMAVSGATIPAKEFGASDCRCRAHLIHFKYRSSIGSLQQVLNDSIPPAAPLTFVHYRENCS